MFAFVAHWCLFVILNILAGATAVIWGLRYTSSREDLVGFLANWTTIFLGQVVLVQTLLGILGWLNPWSALMVLGAVFVVSVVLFKRTNETFQIPLQWGKDLKSAGLFLRREKSALVVLLLVVWILLGFTIAALAEPSSLWDALAYHLPTAADWMQSQRLQPSYVPWAEIANSYFPGNGELLYLWALAPFRNDLLVRIVSVCMWLVLAIALSRVCRKVGASGQASAAATILFLFTPIVLSQATELTLDMTSTAIFLLALGHLLEFEQSRRLESVVLLSVASGLFLGVKYSGPAYLLLLFFGLIATLVWRGWGKSPSLAVIDCCVVFAIGTTMFGGYWYIRNLVFTGNPVYPLQVSLLNQTIFPGALRGFHYQFVRLLDHLGDIPLLDLLEAASRGIGFPYLFMLTMSVFLLLEQFAPRHRRDESKRPGLPTLILVLGFIVGSLALYLNTPYSIMRYGHAPITVDSLAGGMRLGMIAFALCVVLIALGLSHRPEVLGVLWLILSLAVTQSALLGPEPSAHSSSSGKLMSIRQSTVAGAIIAVGAFAYYAWKIRRPDIPRRLLRRCIPAVLVIVTFVIGVGLYGVEQHRERFRYIVYRAYRDAAAATGGEWIAEHVHDARVAISGFHFSYPLYGVDLRNRVRYVNITGKLDDRHHNYEAFAYRDDGSYDVWLRNLREWGAQYLVLSDAIETEEEQWVAEHPEVFSLVFSTPEVRIYRINATSH